MSQRYPTRFILNRVGVTRNKERQSTIIIIITCREQLWLYYQIFKDKKMVRSFYKSKDAECSVEIDFSKKKKKRSNLEIFRIKQRN